MAGDWSTGKVPVSIDVACIGSGHTVFVETSGNQAAVVQGAGSLVVSGGKLEVLSTLEPSILGNLTVTNSSTLNSASEIDVTKSFTGSGGAYAIGTGSIVIEPGATGSLGETSGQSFGIEELTLDNKGTFTIGLHSGLGGGKNARLVNSGTLLVNGEPSGEGHGIRFGEATLANTGTVEKTEGSGITTVGFVVENEGTISSVSGALELTHGGTSGTTTPGSWASAGSAEVVFANGTFSLGAHVPISGLIEVAGAKVTTGEIEGSAATLKLNGNQFTTLKITGSATSTVQKFEMTTPEENVGAPIVESSSTLEVTNHFSAGGKSTLTGKGVLVIGSGATGVATSSKTSSLKLDEGWKLENEGTLTIGLNAGIEGHFSGSNTVSIVNWGTFIVNGETYSENHGLIGQLEGTKDSILYNYGTLKKTEGTAFSEIQWWVNNYGPLYAETGKLSFYFQTLAPHKQIWGEEEEATSPRRELAMCGENESVGCATGNFSQSQPDFAIGGRGVGLDLTRTYNSQAAAEGTHGPFGYGWSSTFSGHIIAEPLQHQATLVQSNGSSIPFTEVSEGVFTAPEWSQDTLAGSSETAFTLTLENQTVYRFAGASGRLESLTDRNGNETKLGYSGAGRLQTITDPDGRTITLAYNGEGLVESATDPMGHVVKYTYESGNLASVTEPGEVSARWKFKYDGSHEITEMTDGRSGKTIMEYDGSHRVTSQTDPMSRKTMFEYLPMQTITTNHATGAVTVESFASTGEPVAITHGYGTPSATTELFTYNKAGEVLAKTDGDGHTTRYSYDAHGNRTSETDPAGRETKWTYDSTHDVETETKPNGEKTTYTRDVHGNVLAEERPAPESATQSTSYEYDGHGDREKMTNPVGKTWEYEYDAAGDRTAEIDPEGDKRTWAYNEDSQETATVSPRGHAGGEEESKYRTTTERDSQGRTIKITDPLGHTTKYTYDADGNVETKTDAETNATTYTYDADNELTAVKEPNGTVTKTAYDGAGQVISQTDGNEHVTKLVRNILEEIEEEVRPSGAKTKKEYDHAGNLVSLVDAAGRTTNYKYDADNHIVEISYSDGTTPTVKYEYTVDGRRKKMVDGTGTTNYSYDQLDRLDEVENGHKEVIKYEYDLADHITKITYPNGKAVTRTFDETGRLESVTDWLSHTTKFTYDPDSNVAATIYPTATKNQDNYSYDNADRMTKVTMLRSAETLASLAYTHTSDGDIRKITAKELPGAEETESTYDENERLTKYGAASYEYDAANNPTTIGSVTGTYNEDDQPEETSGTAYTYNEVGQRTKTTPETGPATTYGWDQAGDLITVKRPEEGEAPKIEDSYAYDGDGLRASQTINGTTAHLAWETAEEIPLILSDTTNSYIYGPDGHPIEQINNNTGTVFYLHHDQQGSTRILTNSTGEVEGKCSYGAYGTSTCEGTATTPLSYDGQYTDADTGLIYLRARYYDPSTAQFLSIDPKVSETLAAYQYGGDNPLNRSDPTGLASELSEASKFSHAWLKQFGRINRWAARHHVDIGLFDDYALTGYYAELYNLTSEPYQGKYEISWNFYYNLTIKHVVRALEPLALGLETADSPGDVVNVLIKTAKSVFNI